VVISGAGRIEVGESKLFFVSFRSVLFRFVSFRSVR